jgi:hypothetical protein
MLGILALQLKSAVIAFRLLVPEIPNSMALLLPAVLLLVAGLAAKTFKQSIPVMVMNFVLVVGIPWNRHYLHFGVGPLAPANGRTTSLHDTFPKRAVRVADRDDHARNCFSAIVSARKGRKKLGRCEKCIRVRNNSNPDWRWTMRFSRVSILS